MYKTWTRPRNPNFNWYYHNWQEYSQGVIAINQKNHEIYKTAIEKWKKIRDAIADLYGKSSNQYKYWLRSEPETPPEIINRLNRFGREVQHEHNLAVERELQKQRHEERRIRLQEKRQQKWIDEHSVVP